MRFQRISLARNWGNHVDKGCGKSARITVRLLLPWAINFYVHLPPYLRNDVGIN
jgi:hypothetical protein